MKAIRKLVILIDGTLNDKDSENSFPTNVAKFYDAIISDKKTLVKYDSGPGTLINTALTGGLGDSKVLKEHLLEAYEWIAQRMKDEGYENKLYIFGFSRGAYLSRVLSWVLLDCGIPFDANLCKERLEFFRRKDFDRLKSIIKNDKIKVSNDFISFLGVWDTVKASNWPDVNDGKLSPIVKKACHAMALDEKRKNFQVLKFESAANVTQLWFAGSHSDIGGGYKDSSLSDISCKWMAANATKAGLKFKKEKMDNLNPDPLGAMHDEYEKPLWKCLGKACRIFDNEEIHKSVTLRISGMQYAPCAENFKA